MSGQPPLPRAAAVVVVVLSVFVIGAEVFCLVENNGQGKWAAVLAYLLSSAALGIGFASIKGMGTVLEWSAIIAAFGAMLAAGMYAIPNAFGDGWPKIAFAIFGVAFVAGGACVFLKQMRSEDADPTAESGDPDPGDGA